MSCECKQVKTNRNYYRYYDSPEGCDVFKKMMATSRIAAFVGVIVSTEDVLLYSHAVGLGPILRRYLFHTGPMVLMGATFAAVANGMYLYRKVDDHLNYFLGGFACGPILAMYVGSYHAVLAGGLIMGAIAVCKKEALLKGAELFPQPITHMRTITWWRKDYTLTRDPIEDMQHTCDQQKK